MRKLAGRVAATFATTLTLAACAATTDDRGGTDGKAPYEPGGAVPLYDRTAVSAAEYLGVDDRTAYVKNGLKARAQRVRVAFGALPTPLPGEGLPPFVSCPLRVVVIDRRCDVLATPGIDDEVICRAAPRKPVAEPYVEAEDVDDDRIVWVALGAAPGGQDFEILGPAQDPELEQACAGGVERPRDTVRRCVLRAGGSDRPAGTLSTYAYRIRARAYWYGTNKPAEGQSCPELDPHFVVRN
jgi:hypothetical protein